MILLRDFRETHFSEYGLKWCATKSNFYTLTPFSNVPPT